MRTLYYHEMAFIGGANGGAASNSCGCEVCDAYFNQVELDTVEVKGSRTMNITIINNPVIVVTPTQAAETEDKCSWGNFGKSMAAGAVTGAITGAGMGSVTPVVGTGLGAASGAVLGGIGGGAHHLITCW